MYKIIKNLMTGEINTVQRLSDNAYIPFDPFNTDAQEFASWLWAGNIPEPAEEGGEVSELWIDELLKKFGYEDGVGG